jgi:uncharacterized protein
MDILSSLKQKLLLNDKWPLPYMFKFIVPSDMKKVAQVEALFDEKALVYRKESKTGKFISITAKQDMYVAEQIIDIYKQAAKIENIVAL